MLVSEKLRVSPQLRLRGPRCDGSLSNAERSSIRNAIWLCSNCATEIDVNKARYSVELLHEWKRKAEALADAEKGKRQPHADDARNELIAAFSGLPVPFDAHGN